MKNLILISTLSVFAFSCTNTKEKSSLEDLNNQKTILVAKIDSLSILLKNVENEIADLDTSKRLQIVRKNACKNISVG